MVNLIVIVMALGVLLMLVAIVGRESSSRSVATSVDLYAVRRRRELDQFKFEARTDARRLRHELRREMRQMDSAPPEEGDRDA